jgi:tetratricopeptide (TPR) repeat protein
VLAARAETQLAAMRAAQGGGDEAMELLRSAFERTRGLEGEGAADLIAETLTSLGHLLEERGDFEAARAEYRRAFDAGRSDADPDARRLAVVSGCHLHRLLHHADRPDEARSLLAPLEAVVPTLVPPARTLLAALVARSRGHQQFRDGDRDAADATLRRGESLARQVGGPESADLVRQLATERGNLALAADRAADAEEHFTRALEAPRGARPEPVEMAERAEIVLRLGQTRLHLGRSQGRADLREAFERGRDSGRAQGRSVAAVAALQLADTLDGPIEERRRLYEAAARLGQLSGTERGREVAAAVVERLRELAE